MTILLIGAEGIASWMLTGHNNRVSTIAFSLNSKYLAWTTEGPEASISHTTCSPDGDLIVSASYNIMKSWDSSNGKLLNAVESVSEVQAVALSPSDMLATGDKDAVSLWKKDTEVNTSKWKHEELEISEIDNSGRPRAARSYGTVRAVTFSPKGDTIASGSDNGFLQLWDLGTLGRYSMTHQFSP
ncbi:hypothetical protein F4781DRAFT_437846 [Annulohypoxylon bovei var. microspora]|nr:hypothetical protein F4781DRAFT_437846 [Annulohypoxylon bovei var. microspora]